MVANLKTVVIYHGIMVIYRGILTLENVSTAINYSSIFITFWCQCYKTLIYRHSTGTPSFCVIKQYYDGNCCGMTVSNTMAIYCGISMLENDRYFYNIGSKLLQYLNPRLSRIFYHGNLPL